MGSAGTIWVISIFIFLFIAGGLLLIQFLPRGGKGVGQTGGVLKSASANFDNCYADLQCEEKTTKWISSEGCKFYGSVCGPLNCSNHTGNC